MRQRDLYICEFIIRQYIIIICHKGNSPTIHKYTQKRVSKLNNIKKTLRSQFCLFLEKVTFIVLTNIRSNLVY
jgi:hypothetical protein